MFQRIMARWPLLAVVAASMYVFGGAANAAGGDGESATLHFGTTFLLLAIVLIAGKVGNIVEKFGQPAVLGELVAGIILSAAAYFGAGIMDEVRGSEIIAFAASFGSVLLLFSIGLESNIGELKKVGKNALGVALIGVSVPFVLGAWVLGPIFFPDADSNAHLFLGAAMVATSVGITATVFRQLGIQKTKAAQTVIGAAVIDDVLGLIVLAIVSALAQGGDLTGGLLLELTTKSFGFLIGSYLLGRLIAKPLGQTLSMIHTGIGMKLTLALGFALLWGFLAEEFGLEPIIGAFAAGLLLDNVHFTSFDEPAIVDDLREIELEAKDRKKVTRLINKHKHAHVEDLIGNIGLIFIPIFFVYTGLQIDFASLLDPQLYLVATLISIVAIAAKMIAGFAAQGDRTEKLLVGSAMVPRGEVGLIFAAVGKQLGAIDQEMFSTIILVVIITTFVAPFMIKHLANTLNSK